MDDVVNFTIHLTGSETGKTWVGDFTARKFLSHRQKLERDALIREWLGQVNPHLSLQADRAARLADCRVSLTKYPDWWQNSNHGQDLCDDNLLEAVQGQVYSIQKEAVETVQKRAREAADKLKAEVK